MYYQNGNAFVNNKINKMIIILDKKIPVKTGIKFYNDFK